MIQRWGIRIVLAFALCALAGAGLLAGVGAAPAQASVPASASSPAQASASSLVRADTSDFSFDSLHTDYRLTRAADGRARLAVTESFVARFPETDQNHGIERAIPTSADGRSLHVQIRSVTDASGTPVPYEIEQQDVPAGFTVLRIGDAFAYVHGEQSYVIRYTMRDVIHQASGGAQQFLFDVNGTGWAQPFGEVSATLRLPPALLGSLSGEKACYQGAQGSTAGCTISRNGSTFTASASELGAHENVTMSVGFTAGTFTVPLSLRRLVVWLLLGAAVVLLALAIVVRVTRLGNPKGTGIIVPQYAAFPGIGVMEAAELLDQRDRAFPALVTQLVVSRAATMTRDDNGTKTTKDDLYGLTLVDARVLDDEDADAVHTLFGSIKPGAAALLDPKDPNIGDRIAKLLREARDSVRKQGLIARRYTALSSILLAIGILLALLTIAWFVVLGSGGFGSGAHYLGLVAALVLVVAAVILLWPRERRTEAAVPAYEHLLGIRDYLRLAEADRIRMLQSPSGAETQALPADAGPGAAADAAQGAAAPDNTVIVKLYEKLLPYAVLMGIEKEWREVLGRYWATTPTEVSPTLLPLQTLLFANAFASHNYATTASTSSNSHSWSSSGGGGFSGGFSGGGFGGGGGGGW